MPNEINSSDGYICLYRKFLKWEWYDDANTMRVFLHCLLSANHADNRWRGVIVKQGSFITSVGKLAHRLNLTNQQVRTSINKLKSTSEITSQGTSQYTIITVNNWNLYQTNNKQTNKRATNEQQTNNKRVTTNNNENNENNDKNENNILDNNKKTKRFKKPTIEEIKNYCLERKNGINAEYFYNYYEAKGWVVGKSPMKNWKSSMITWEIKNKKDKQKETEKPKSIYDTEEQKEFFRKLEERNKERLAW